MWGGHGHTDIATWVAATFNGVQMGSATVYDLSSPK
jgi:hypothetical protein